MDQFVRDCISREMSLRDVAKKYHMKIEDVYQQFQQARMRYTKEEIEAIIDEVYYKI